MSYNRKTNCDHCYYPLNLQDLDRKQWNNDTEEFIFLCSFCEKETIVKSNLFSDGHINSNYINILREDSDYFDENHQEQLYNHLKNCLLCKDRFEEDFLGSIEEKIRFSQKSLSHFRKYSRQELFELEDKDVKFSVRSNKTQIEQFCYDDKEYTLCEDDEFYRNTKKIKSIDDVEEICYYIKENQYVIGHVSFLIKNKKIVLDRIWFLDSETIEKRQKFFEDLKQEKIKIKLGTLEKIYLTLNNI